MVSLTYCLIDYSPGFLHVIVYNFELCYDLLVSIMFILIFF